MKVGVLVGSLRKESFNRKMAKALIALAPSELEMEIIEIAGLSFYNEDSEGNTPSDWTEFRERIRSLDGVLFVTLEYNRSVPGVLKNAIDVASRPYGHSAWDGKPAAVVSVSTGAIGGFGANHHLRQSLVFLNMPCLQQPEMYIGQASDLFDAGGRITRESTVKHAEKFLHAFGHWVKMHASAQEANVEPMRKSG